MCAKLRDKLNISQKTTKNSLLLHRFFITITMNYIQTEIDGVWLIEPKVFSDERGYFMEAFKQEEFEANIGPVNFVQDNESKSSFGVLRGLHYQKGEYSQAKLVRVIKGEVLDVAVDLRKSSPTFGKHVSVLLSEENKRQFFIPRGFAHGFAVLSEEAIFTYKVDNKYTPQAEASILYNDATLGIDWPLTDSQMVLSSKDREGTAFKNAAYFE
jgi:dTDP-4-dehydrorhamnose 3,5-epimerase